MVDPVSLRRQDFVTALRGTSIDVNTAKADPRLAGLDLDAADLDHDGKISGARETAALWNQIDRLDNDGNSSTVLLMGRDGQATPLAEKVAALGDLGRAATLQRLGRAAVPGNDDVIFIGMRSETKSE